MKLLPKIIKHNIFPLAPYCALAILVCALPGCGSMGGTAGRVDIDDEPITGVGIDDVDVRDMSRQMASAILELPLINAAKGPANIAFINIENRTLDPNFDSYNLLSKIRQQLLVNSQGKLVFLDRETMDSIYAERDAKRAGQETSNEQKNLPGVDYFLTGYAFVSKTVGDHGEILAAHRYSFRLTDAETGAVLWEKDYEFKKLGQRGIAFH